MFKNYLKSAAMTLGLFFSLVLTAHAAGSVKELFHHHGDPVVGNPNGKVTVVEFFDYQCSHCTTMAPVIKSIIKSNPEVRIVFKEFPIRGPISNYASRAAIAANKQNKYFAFNHALLSTNLTLSEESILDIAKSVGLNVNILKKEIHSSEVSSELKSNYALAKEFKVSGTPAFFIGKTNATNMSEVDFVLGEMTQGELQDAIDKHKK